MLSFRSILSWLGTIVTISSLFQIDAVPTGCWSPIGNVINGMATSVLLGTTVDMSADGTIIIVGGWSSGNDIVKVMKLNAVTRRWEQLGSNLKGNINAAISADGKTVIVMDEGEVRTEFFVYKLVRDDWIQVAARIDIVGRFNRANLDISADGTVIAISSVDAGIVRVYKLLTSPFRWKQLGSDLKKNTTTYNAFGETIALSANGTVVAIGVPSAGRIYEKGVVRIFKYYSSNSSWVQLGSDVRGTSGSVEYFGSDLVLSADGSTIAIGSNVTNYYERDTVRVYKFSSSTSQWLQLAQTIYGKENSDKIGKGVAISADGKIIAVGGRLNDGISSDENFNSGHVRVFAYETSPPRWVRVGFDINGVSRGGHFGETIAMSADGTKLVIGAPQVGGIGQVRVYGLSRCNTTASTVTPVIPSVAGRWTQIGNIINWTSAGNNFGIYFGTDVAMSSDGTTVASVGRYTEFFIAKLNSTTKVWDKLDSKFPGGMRISMSADGTMVLATSFTWYYSEKFSTIATTEFQVYRSVSDDWVQVGSNFSVPGLGFAKMSADGTVILISCGMYKLLPSPLRWVPIVALPVCPNVDFALSANGTIVAVSTGSSYRDGPVQVYRLNTSSARWVQLGNNITGESTKDQFGAKVVLSADGTTIAIGAPKNNGTALESGHVRVFKLNLSSSRWSQLGADLDGEGRLDRTGSSIAISRDGTTVAIGAPTNKGNGESSERLNIGHVRVYRYFSNQSQWRLLGSDIDGDRVDGLFGSSVAMSADGKTIAVGATGSYGYTGGQVTAFRFVSNTSALPV